MKRTASRESLVASGLKCSCRVTVKRFFTTPGVDPADELAWEYRSAGITGEDGRAVLRVTINRPEAKIPIRSHTLCTWLSRWLESRMAMPRSRTSRLPRMYSFSLKGPVPFAFSLKSKPEAMSCAL
mgnify:CR=1 FL=1